MKEPICIIGLWHQGIVAAACFADLGYDVIAADHDEARIAALNQGKPPLYEPGLDELLGRGIGSGRLRFVSDIPAAVQGCHYVLFMFDTPVDENDQSDLSELFATAEEMAPHLEAGTSLYVTAQVPVGTCDALAAVIRKKNPDADFGVAYSPENLRLGQAIARFLKPALPVVGSDDKETLDRVIRLLSALDAEEWTRVDLRTAEMCKHALNAFLALSVCFGNELGNICDEVGANGESVAKVLRMEERVGRKAMLLPGLGFSGGTLARDMQTLRGLGRKHDLETKLLDGAWAANQSQNGLVLRKLKKVFGDLAGVSVAVLGLTYKPDTSTLRRSAAIEIIGDLVREGAIVHGHDPKADRAELAAHAEFTFDEDVYEVVKGARALVLITPWKDYQDLDFGRIREAMSTEPLIIDTANRLDGHELEQLGFRYMDIGRGRRPA